MQRLSAVLIAVSAAVPGFPAATADPVAPDDPELTGPPVAVGAASPDPFAAASAQSQADPAGVLGGLLAGGPSADALMVAVGLNAPPPLDPLASAGVLLPQNYRMPSGEVPSPYVLQTGVPPGPFARVDALKGTHAVVHGALGRMPGAELGQPLPGIAPPAGMNIPAGLEQFYVGPATLPPDGRPTTDPPG